MGKAVALVICGVLMGFTMGIMTWMAHDLYDDASLWSVTTNATAESPGYYETTNKRYKITVIDTRDWSYPNGVDYNKKTD